MLKIHERCLIVLQTLQGFASAAGFTEADARYDIGRPPFVWKAWAVDEFQVSIPGLEVK
jgi:hypothetical protein